MKHFPVNQRWKLITQSFVKRQTSLNKLLILITLLSYLFRNCKDDGDDDEIIHIRVCFIFPDDGFVSSQA